MFSIKSVKRTLLHMVCMIMLILIQFDVCGYDLMRACQLGEKILTDIECTDVTCINDDDDNVSEWDDPMYRGVSPRTFIKSPFIESIVYSFCSFQKETSFLKHIAHYFQAKLSNLTYLRFCVFRI